MVNKSPQHGHRDEHILTNRKYNKENLFQPRSHSNIGAKNLSLKGPIINEMTKFFSFYKLQRQFNTQI